MSCSSSVVAVVALSDVLGHQDECSNQKFLIDSDAASGAACRWSSAALGARWRVS